MLTNSWSYTDEMRIEWNFLKLLLNLYSLLISNLFDLRKHTQNECWDRELTARSERTFYSCSVRLCLSEFGSSGWLNGLRFLKPFHIWRNSFSLIIHNVICHKGIIIDKKWKMTMDRVHWQFLVQRRNDIVFMYRKYYKVVYAKLNIRS